MALSGNFNSPVYGTNLQLRCTWSGVQSVEGNYTDITVIAYLQYYQIDISGRTGTITVGSSSQYFDIGAIYDMSAGQKQLKIMERTVRVYHDSDGTKSVYLFARFPYNGSYSGQPVSNLDAEDTVTLDTIPRASEIVSVGSFNVEDTLSVEVDKKAQSFSDTLTISLGGETIKTITDYESEDSISFSDTEQLKIYNLIDDWSDTFTFTISTYNSGTLIGTDSATATGTIKGDVTYHTGGADKKATFYIGTSNGVKRCITYDGTKRAYR